MGWQRATAEEKASLGLKDTNNNLYRFRASFEDANLRNLIYAPTSEGAYYVQLNAQARAELFAYHDIPYKYISVTFVKALFDNTFEWRNHEGLYQQSNPFLIEEEKAFIRNWWNERLPASFDLMSPSVVDPVTGRDRSQPPKIWLRSSTGREMKIGFKKLFDGLNPVDIIKEDFAKVLARLWERPTATRASKPPRYTAVTLANKLKIFFELTGWNRFGMVDKLFERLINKINESRSKNDCVLELVRQRPLAPYLPLSSNPFGLYTSYIHADDWHSYISNLAESGDPPIRKFIKHAFKEMGTVQANYEKRAKAVRDLIVSLSEGFIKGTYTGWSDATKKAIQRLDMSTDHFEHLPDSVIGRWRELNAAKIENAVGKRDQEDDQKKVMSKSAPVVAGSVGWSWKPGAAKNDHQMKNNLYIAEVRASLGSLSESTDQGATSQMPDNLVLGTSETNSLMTRYEYAWQDLFKAEQILEGKRTITGELEVFCNLPNEPIRYDKLDKDRYTWDYINSLSVDESVQQGPSVQNDTIKTSEMRAMAASYKFVAYTITYIVELSGTSRILNRNNPSLQMVFYPFMRPFFHMVEKQLDDLLFKEMKKLM